jgi:hypothetical protein
MTSTDSIRPCSSIGSRWRAATTEESRRGNESRGTVVILSVKWSHHTLSGGAQAAAVHARAVMTRRRWPVPPWPSSVGLGPRALRRFALASSHARLLRLHFPPRREKRKVSMTSTDSIRPCSSIGSRWRAATTEESRRGNESRGTVVIPNQGAKLGQVMIVLEAR